MLGAQALPPYHSGGWHSYHQDKLVCPPDMHCDILQPSNLPLSSLAALPSILQLPIDFHTDSIALTPSPLETSSLLNDDQSFLDPSASTQHHPTFFHPPLSFSARTQSFSVEDLVSLS